MLRKSVDASLEIRHASLPKLPPNPLAYSSFYSTFDDNEEENKAQTALKGL